MCGATILKASQLGSLKKSRKYTLIVLSKDSKNLKHDTHAKQLSKLVSSSVCASVNSSWLLDSLCLYQVQDSREHQYAVKS